ncbi:MAG: succinylglutamate desuccinylase [Alteromonadaceae bacterium]|jgi:hypothetical protein|uniref:DUF1826 domain-containing protein n=1 Tax=Paraglaciecola mesophila TaxID=197222 RepID=A0ABU9T0V5_9ALTE|nr:succinylglutamate desuccinylase [Alteromonadaceae bacterium]MBB20540.1 succinylglutamate desuccinylase [Rickettsiales bacterium]
MSIATPLHDQEHIIDEQNSKAFLPEMTYSHSDEFTVLTDIYQDKHNLVVWQRSLSEELLAHVAQCIEENPRLNLEKSIRANAIAEDITAALSPRGFNEALTGNIASLVDMFCCLFDLKRVGLRLKVLEQAMCPRFHVDWVPCRLVTTFSGSGTQWLTNDKVDRTKLGTGNNGMPDAQSGLYDDLNAIQALSVGDVALLKGEGWEGNEGAGLVHRSPPNEANEKRLLLTLDFIV